MVAEVRRSADAMEKHCELSEVAAGNRAIADRLEKLEAEVERLSRPNIFWNPDDPEVPVQFDADAENYEVGDYTEFTCGRTLQNRWFAIGRDDDGDNTFIGPFMTKDEAVKAAKEMP